MKKNYVIILLIIMFGLGIVVDKLVFSNNDIDDGFNGLSQVKHENMLSMMLETGSGSGEYSLETRSSWPTKEDGYVFNSTLSKCEKGSKLRWDDTNSLVVMEGTSSDKCYVYFDKYNFITINNSSATVSGNSIVITIDATAGDGEISKYYYSKDNGLSYNESASSTYTFSSLAIGTYNVKYYVEDSNGMSSEVISKEVSITSMTLASYVKSLYTGTQGDNGLYYHNSSLANGAEDNSYRYAGANQNNYVCFGTDTSACPDDNLYRIIGVFGDQVKLIKWDYANSDLLGTDGDYTSDTLSTSSYSNYKGSKTTINEYSWNTIGGNTWSASKLNTVNLNTNYINNIGSTWANKIATITWIVGGNTPDNIVNTVVSNAYKNEITSPAENTTYSDKVALMYISDYGYAASPKAWTKKLSSYNNSDVTSINWMYMGLWEWLVTRRSDSTGLAINLRYSGDVYIHSMQTSNVSGCIRPVFYLNSDVVKVGNQQGTKNDPYRIN